MSATKADEGMGLILLSGGLDSATALALARRQGQPLNALHVSYRQAAERGERAAAGALAAHFSVPLRVVKYSGSQFGVGEIRGRNAFLLQVALLEFPASSGTIYIAVHDGTEYRDCSEDFVEMMQRVYDFHAEGAVVIGAPFLDLRKGDIARLARELDVPIDVTHSCEAADVPCRECQSCLDRAQVLANDGVARS